MRQRPFRVLRATVFAAVCVTVSAILHILAGGMPLSPSAIAYTAVGLSGVSYALTAHERGAIPVFLWCAGVQTALHVLFTQSFMWASSASHLSHAGDHLSPGMVVVHALAAVLSAAWLCRWESALARFLGLATAALADLVCLRVVPGRSSFTVRTVSSVGPRTAPGRPTVAVLAVSRRLRGPPSRSIHFN